MSRAAATLAVFLLGAQSWAQTPTGTITGALRDPDNAFLTGVSVSVINLDTGARFDTVTTDVGVFRVESLVPGNYNILTTYQGTNVDTRVEIAQAGQSVNIGALVLTPARTEQPQNPVAAPVPQSVEEIERGFDSVTVTARRVEEEVQDVPLPVSVVSGPVIERAGAFNVNRLKELVPTVQFYSSNPRNSAVTIRGLGSPFGLTNDGIDSGVGFYVDGVFYARPAAATLDFLDLERIEVLRGPQGTLFGKNTTAGAINITTRRPTFDQEHSFELSYGNFGFIQAKGSFSGAVYKDKVAARISFSGTQRDGLLYNVRTQDDVNDLNNTGVRGQIYIVPRPNLSIMLTGDYTRQRPEGFAQVVAGVAPTLRPANRQYDQMAADFNYTPPSFNAFDRLIDTDTPWRSNQDMGGGSVAIDWDRGSGVLTAITSWRWWDWGPSNDRDFTGLPVTTISAAPSNQKQFTQEIRYAGRLNTRANFIVGYFLFKQNLQPDGFHKQEQGAAAARFLLAPSAAANTPGLLDGYGQNIDFDYDNTSSAVFGQIEYKLTERLNVIPGLRYNYDNKKIDYNQTVYGGLQTTDPALIALQRSVLSPLAYRVDAGDHNVSGQLTLSYKTSANSNVYATYSTSFKPIGLNLGGVPTDAAGNPVLSAATVRPERVGHWELGVKSSPFRGVTANLTFHDTGIRDYQTQVVNAQVGVLRGYLANAERVRVRGIELDTTARLSANWNLYGSVAFTDGRYTKFTDAPPPLEETGGPQVKDVSGSVLPGISKWAYSVGAEYIKRSSFLSINGEYFARVDASYRSSFSSNASASHYLNIDAYSLVNPRAGFRSRDGWEVSVWARNFFNTDYFELLSPAPGNSGLFVGLPGDQRTFGITLRKTLTAGTN